MNSHTNAKSKYYSLRAPPDLGGGVLGKHQALDGLPRRRRIATLMYTPPPISVYCLYLKSCILSSN